MTSSRDRVHHHILLAALLAAHAVVLTAYFIPVVAGTDDNGYHLAARMLLEHGRIHQEVGHELEFVGRMWVETPDGRFYPKYPPVYPVAVALAMWSTGDLGGLLLSPILGWSCGLAIFLLSRRLGLPGDLSLLGAFTFATLPLVNSFAVTQVSHATSLALLAWGYLMLITATDSEESTDRLLLVGSGLLIGLAAGVRYTDALLVLPGLVWLGLAEGRHRRRRLKTWLGTWLAPVLLIGLYHTLAFGGPLTTAYSLTEEQAGFALSYLAQNARIYAATLPTLLLGPITILAGFGFLLAWRRSPRRGLYLLAWLVPPVLTYLAYYWAPEEHPRSYLRFLLPLAIPAIPLAMRALDEAASRFQLERQRRFALLATVLCVQGAWGVAGSLDQLERLYGHNDLIADQVALVRRHAPAGSTVIAELATLDPLDYHQEHDLYWASLFDRGALDRALDRTLADGPDSLQPGRAELLRDRLLDVEATLARQRLRALLDEALGAGREVFVAGSAATLAKLKRFADDAYHFEVIARHPEGKRSYRLFPAGRTVSRASEDRGVFDPAFHVWRLEAATR